jgi:dolichyl-phosphate-mannose-protein mannosyltransferase
VAAFPITSTRAQPAPVIVAGRIVQLAGRPHNLILLPICVVAIALRLSTGVFQGPRAGWPEMQLTNIDLAANIADGNGYATTISPGTDFANSNGPPPAWGVAHRVSGFVAPPSEYYLPGYPLLIAPLVKLLGPSYEVAQGFNALLDGVTGPALVYLLLSTFGLSRAGVFAAAVYASTTPFLWQAGLVLPDALSAVLSLGPCVLVARALRSRRPSAWLFVAGLTIGLAVWFRGEVLALMVTLVVITALCFRGHQRALGAVILAGWLVGAAPLAVFWQHEYGYLTLSRPGLGVRLWEGLGRLDNPWGIKEDDRALSAFLTANGYQYGTGAGDSFALQTAAAHIAENPESFVTLSLNRAGAVLSNSFLTDRPYDLAIANSIPDPLKVAATLLFMLAVPIGLRRMFKVDIGLGLLVSALWVSRAIPFAMMHEERRDLIPLLVPYLLCVAILSVRVSSRLPNDRSPRTAAYGCRWLAR